MKMSHIVTEGSAGFSVSGPVLGVAIVISVVCPGRVCCDLMKGNEHLCNQICAAKKEMFVFSVELCTVNLIKDELF